MQYSFLRGWKETHKDIQYSDGSFTSFNSEDSIPFNTFLGMVRDGIHVGSLGQQLDESGRTNNAQTAGFDLANASTVNQAPNLIPQPKSSRSAPRMPKNEGSDAL